MIFCFCIVVTNFFFLLIFDLKANRSLFSKSFGTIEYFCRRSAGNMGAKQSKRSVDISGKEAEGGEVAVAGAGGEGRVEQLADADALKPQLNGAAHIQLEETVGTLI